MFICRFAGAEYRRSVGLLTNVQTSSSDMYLGWPSFNTLDSLLRYVGPLLASCACSTKLLLLWFRTIFCPRVGVSGLRGMERQHTHQVSLERLPQRGLTASLSREAWFAIQYFCSPFYLLAAGFWNRRVSLLLMSLLVVPRPVFLRPLLLCLLAKVFRTVLAFISLSWQRVARSH